MTMTYVKPPFYASSSFWTHMGVSSASAASIADTLHNNAFIVAHPLLAAGIVASGLFLIGISQAAYVIGNAIKATAQAGSSSNGVGAIIP